MRKSVLAILLLFPLAAHAQVITGTAKAIDGDTLEMGGQRIRLGGIDALEAQQTCIPGISLSFTMQHSSRCESLDTM